VKGFCISVNPTGKIPAFGRCRFCFCCNLFILQNQLIETTIILVFHPAGNDSYNLLAFTRPQCLSRRSRLKLPTTTARNTSQVNNIVVMRFFNNILRSIPWGKPTWSSLFKDALTDGWPAKFYNLSGEGGRPLST